MREKTKTNKEMKFHAHINNECGPKNEQENEDEAKKKQTALEKRGAESVEGGNREAERGSRKVDSRAGKGGSKAMRLHRHITFSAPNTLFTISIHTRSHSHTLLRAVHADSSFYFCPRGVCAMFASGACAKRRQTTPANR